MTVKGNKQTVSTIARHMNSIDKDFRELKRDFVGLNEHTRTFVDDIEKQISENVNTAISDSEDEIVRGYVEPINVAIEDINERLDKIEAALLMNPIKRWWNGMKGRLLT